MQSLSYLDAVKHFAGSDGYETVYMKGKSDYVVEPLNEQGMLTAMHGLQKLPPGAIGMICDAYGGAISKVAPDATAFAHRNALFCIQYYCAWGSPAASLSKLTEIRGFYDSLRPYMSGGAYVNYPDLDLKNYAVA